MKKKRVYSNLFEKEGLQYVRDIRGIEAPSHTFYVSKRGSNVGSDGSIARPFLTIEAALSVANVLATTNVPVCVFVFAGEYTENPLVVNTNVALCGEGQDVVVLFPIDNTQTFISLTDHTSLENITIRNVSFASAVKIEDAEVICVLNKCYIKECATAVEITSDGNPSYAFLEYVSIDNPKTYGIQIYKGSQDCEVSIENTYIYETDNVHTNAAIYNDGGKLIAHSGAIVNQFSVGNGTAIFSINGGDLRVRNMQIEGYNYGVKTDSGGANFALVGNTYDLNVFDFYINDALATGYDDGCSPYDKTLIHPNSSFFIAGSDNNVITVAKKGGNFTSLDAALASITDNSATKRYTIRVGAGVFVGDTFTGKPFVSIVGENFTDTIIEVDNPNKDVCIAVGNFALYNLQLRGATASGKAALIYNGGTGVFRCVDVRFGANNMFLKQNSTNGTSTVALQNCSAEATSNFNPAFDVQNNGVNQSTFVLNTFTYTGLGANFVSASGVLSQFIFNNVTIQKTIVSGVACELIDGAVGSLTATTFIGFTTALSNPNTGAGCIVYATGFSIHGCTNDIVIANPNTYGAITANATASKTSVAAGSTLALQLADVTGNGTINLGKLYLGDDYNDLYDSRDLIESNDMGWHEGGELSVGIGLDLNINEGFGYLEDGVIAVYRRISWNTQTVSIPANSDLYVYFNQTGTVQLNAARPYNQENIILGRVVTNGSSFRVIEQAYSYANHVGNKFSNMARNVFGALFESGGILSVNTLRQIEITGGKYWVGESQLTFTQSNYADTFHPIYRGISAGTWVDASPTDIIDNSFYDDNSGSLAALSIGNPFVKHAFYLTISEGVTKVYMVYGQTSYSTLVDARDGVLPLIPSWFRELTVLIGTVIVDLNNPTFSEVADLRPRPSFAAAAQGGTVSSHLALTDLTAGDAGHTQFMMLDGSKVMAGNLNMGGNQISNAGNINGVSISTHASRHLPNGSDALATAAAISISRQTSNSAGIANAYARADHSHKVLEEPATVQATSNSTLALNDSSNNKIIFTGNTAGQIVNLGDALTYSVGKVISVWNKSTLDDLSIRDFDNNQILVLVANSKAEFVLQNNTTQAGIWIYTQTAKESTNVLIDGIIDYTKLPRYIFEDFIQTATSGAIELTLSAASGGSSTAEIAEQQPNWNGVLNKARIGQTSLRITTTNNSRIAAFSGTIYKLYDSAKFMFGAEFSLVGGQVDFTLDPVLQSIGFLDSFVSGNPTNGFYFRPPRVGETDFLKYVIRIAGAENVFSSTIPYDSVARHFVKVRIEWNGVLNQMTFTAWDENTISISELNDFLSDYPSLSIPSFSYGILNARNGTASVPVARNINVDFIERYTHSNF